MFEMRFRPKDKKITECGSHSGASKYASKDDNSRPRWKKVFRALKLCTDLLLTRLYRTNVRYFGVCILVYFVAVSFLLYNGSLLSSLSYYDYYSLSSSPIVASVPSHITDMMLAEKRIAESLEDSDAVPSQNSQTPDCKIAIISTYPPRQCGIGTFAHMLFEGLLETSSDCDIHVFALTRTDSMRPLHRTNYFPEVVMEIPIDGQDIAGNYMVLAAAAINLGKYSAVLLNHEFAIYAHPWDPIILLKKMDVPLKLTIVHTPRPYMQLADRGILRHLGLFSDGLIVMTASSQSDLRIGYGLDNVKMVPHPFNPTLQLKRSQFSNEQLKRQLGINGRFVVMTNGLLHEHKGIVFMIRAIPLLVERIPNLLFLVVGEEHPDHANKVLPRLRKEMKNIGVSDYHVRFITRFLTLAEIERYILASEVYLTLFVGNIVLNSGTLSNALSVGGAAVISSQFDFAQTIIGQDRGVIVPYRDPVLLANAIEMLYKDPVLRRALASNAANFMQRFSLKATSEYYLCLLSAGNRVNPVSCEGIFAAANNPQSLSILDVTEQAAYRVSLHGNTVTTYSGYSQILRFPHDGIYNLFMDNDIMINGHVVNGRIYYLYAEFEKKDVNTTNAPFTSRYHFRSSAKHESLHLKTSVGFYDLDIRFDSEGEVQVILDIRTLHAFPEGLLAAPYKCTFFSQDEVSAKNPWENQEMDSDVRVLSYVRPLYDFLSGKSWNGGGNCTSQYLRVKNAQRRAYDNADFLPQVTIHENESECRKRCQLAGFRCSSYSWDGESKECRVHTGNRPDVPTINNKSKTTIIFAARLWSCSCSESLRDLDLFQIKGSEEDPEDITNRETISCYGQDTINGHDIVMRDTNSKAYYRIEMEGTYFMNEGVATVNRHMVEELIKSPDTQIKIVPVLLPKQVQTKDPDLYYSLSVLDTSKFASGPSLSIRSKWPFNPNPPSDPDSFWVIQQPWEFGYVPLEWVGIIKQCVDELWVCSYSVKDGYVDSGVPEGVVHVIPHGVDAQRFSSSHPPYHGLQTRASFKFLFVGGLLPRKGVDVLLKAYSATFSAADDVALVVSARYGDDFYRDEIIEAVHSHQTDKLGVDKSELSKIPPEIEFIDHDLTAAEIVGLYTASDVFVSPFRGEGFGLTIFEAMATGLPVIVTNASGPRDFLTNKTAYLVEAQRSPCLLPPCGLDSVFGTRAAGQPYWFEPDQRHLSILMRHVFEHPAKRAEIALAGRRFVQKNVTWDKAGALYRKRIEAIHKRHRPIRQRNPHCLVSNHTRTRRTQ